MTSEEFKAFYQTKDFHHVDQEKRDIGGGKISFSEIDKISEFKSFDKVMISGLRQDTFEYFIQTQAYHFNAIMFWKNKLIEDWSLLSTLRNVKFIGFFHNQRITRMWDMSQNELLEGLYISDFTRLHTLDGIKNAPRLERLYFGDAVWCTSILNDIKALEESELKEFSFGGKAIESENISIYTKMPKLQILDFPSNLYTTEQIAWLVAKLPNVKGYSLKPYIKLETPLSGKDVLICGKRKPFLSSKQNADRFLKYTLQFERLVNQYRQS